MSTPPSTWLHTEIRLALERAIERPTEANVIDLLQQVISACEQVAEPERLLAVGQAIVQLADILQAKSERWLGHWQEQELANDEDSVSEPFDLELLAGLVQRTMHLDVSDLIKQKPPKPRRRSPKPPEDSIVGVVDKAKLLEVVDQETAKQTALSIAHDEDVSAWVRAIGGWLEQQMVALPDQGTATETWVEASLMELQTGLKQQQPRMSLIKVWLALLLGGFQLEQRGDFYQVETIVVHHAIRSGSLSDGS